MTGGMRKVSKLKSAAFRNFSWMLALVKLPGSCKTVLDWCPFEDGVCMNDILVRSNERCIHCYEQYKWTEENIERYAQGLNVMLFDLSTLKKLRLEDFDTIHIIVVDPASIKDDNKSLMYVGTQLSRSHHTYLIQVCHMPEGSADITLLAGLPFVPSDPPVITSSQELIDWLIRYCAKYVSAMASIPGVSSVMQSRIDPASAGWLSRSDVQEMTSAVSPAPAFTAGPPRTPLEQVTRILLEELPDVAEDIRDESLLRGISGVGARDYAIRRAGERVSEKVADLRR